MKKVKEEKGGITLFVIISILFIMAILMGVYWKSTNYQVTVLQAEQRIKDIYGQDVKNVDSVHEEIKNYEAGYLTVKSGVQVNGGIGMYKGAVIPEGFTVSGISGEAESVDDGIVIYDIPAGIDTNVEGFWTADEDNNGFPDVQENYNQFVWVPVVTPFVTSAEITDIIDNKDLTSFAGETSNQKAINYLIANENKYPMAVKMSDGNYRGILYDFAEGTNGVAITAMDFSINPNESYDYNVSGYKYYYREPGTVCYDYGKDDGGNVLDTNPNTIGLTQIKLQNEYNLMMESVSRYKGFFIARYELGYGTKVEIKRNNNIASANNTNTSTWYGLYSACQGMYNTNTDKVQSMMISGAQYDQTMIWMKNIKNITDNSKYYILDSTGMGIYKVGETNGILSKSGSNDNYKVNQVFDLGGNYWELTSASRQSWSRAHRGGSAAYYGSSLYASWREFSYNRPTYKGTNFSSRPTLYINILQDTNYSI